jgi:hypothetical protein
MPPAFGSGDGRLDGRPDASALFFDATKVPAGIAETMRRYVEQASRL